jgi:hypothetical protein
MGRTRHSRLASYVTPHGRFGKIKVDPHIPREFHGIMMQERVRRHERVELRKVKLLTRQGVPVQKAERIGHRAALKAEHQGLSQHQISVYEGKLGSIAHWHPLKRRD